MFIYNNRGGKDAEIRKLFNEPAWNYQVVRFLDKDGEDIIPRKDRVWTKGELLKRIEKVRHKTAYLSMFCYWTGEVKIGAIDARSANNC